MSRQTEPTMAQMVVGMARRLYSNRKPSREDISAAGKIATLSNSEVARWKVTMLYKAQRGEKPNIPELETA